MTKRLLSVLTVALIALCAGFPLHADEFDSAGVKIHYIVEGQGEPVILIHGLYSSALMNWQLPGIVKALSGRYMVVAFDNRGHGKSDKPVEDDRYGPEMAEDVVRLMDHLHLAKAHVVGYSLGGMIVMKLLATHPERVSSAVVGGMGWMKAGSPLERFWEERPARPGPVPAACLHGMAQLGLTENEVKSIQPPVDIIVGDRDPCRSLYVAPLHTVRPDWPEHVIEGAGHITCVTKPDFKAQLVAALDRAAKK